MLSRIKRFIIRQLEAEKIKKIKTSKYFDEEYYLSQNADVKASGIDPATHFHLYGWKEGRNPSSHFNMSMILKEYPEIRKKAKNPILYVLENKLEKEITKKNLDLKTTASELISSYFRESTPLNTLAVDSEETRLNIIYNGFDSSCFFGGKATALMLAIMFAKKYRYGLRIISQNPEKKVFYDFLKLFNLDYSGKIEFYSTEESDKCLEVGKKDHFLCTMWSNADAVLNTPTITGKVFYIMQEVETFFYDHGDNHLRCFNTLTDERLIPIVNSKLLRDYLLNQGYENVKEGVYFEPSFPKDLYSPSKESFKKKKEYKLFFYARPTHQRNLFYFGLNIINQAFLRGILDPKEWKVYMAGDSNMPDFRFDSRVKLEKLGVMKWDEYTNFAATVDLCYSIIYTPHPSYPPFDFVTSGAVVITNKYQNKGDLHMYSKNIVSGELKEEEMLKKFSEAVALAKNPSKRKKNYESSKINRAWADSFKDVLPFMNDKLKSK